jgi:peptidoglycan/xylan/chitin deacetylase (PgdA/CDA1 family)
MIKNIRKKLVISLCIIVLCSSTGFVLEQYYELSQPGLIVLLYHRITTETSSKNKYVLDIRKFQQQVEYINGHGYSSILPKEIINSNVKKNGRNIIILSFDDGTSDHFSIVYQTLKTNSQKGVFFITTKYVNSRGYLSGDEINEMSHGGMEIGSHSYSHSLLDELNYEEIYHELRESKDQLEEISGEKVYSFAPPGGWFNADVVRAARDVGYKLFFGCEIGTNDLSKKRFLYRRIEVMGNISFEEFQRLLDPPQILSYKVVQSLKFVVHNLIGSKNYQELSNLL